MEGNVHTCGKRMEICSSTYSSSGSTIKTSQLKSHTEILKISEKRRLNSSRNNNGATLEEKEKEKASLPQILVSLVLFALSMMYTYRLHCYDYLFLVLLICRLDWLCVVNYNISDSKSILALNLYVRYIPKNTTNETYYQFQIECLFSSSSKILAICIIELRLSKPSIVHVILMKNYSLLSTCTLVYTVDYQTWMV